MYYHKTIRHGLEVIATLLIAVVLSANAAPTGNGVTYINEAVSLDYTINNYCDSGNIPVNIVGESVFQAKIFEDENGIQSIIGHYSISATGQDANGIRYTINENRNINDKMPEGGPYTMVMISRMITQGSTDNFFFKYLNHISPNEAMKFEVESYCRG